MKYIWTLNKYDVQLVDIEPNDNIIINTNVIWEVTCDNNNFKYNINRRMPNIHCTSTNKKYVSELCYLYECLLILGFSKVLQNKAKSLLKLNYLTNINDNNNDKDKFISIIKHRLKYNEPIEKTEIYNYKKPNKPIILKHILNKIRKKWKYVTLLPGLNIVLKKHFYNEFKNYFEQEK